MKKLAYIGVIGSICCLFLLIGAIKGLVQTERGMINKWNHYSMKRETRQLPEGHQFQIPLAKKQLI